MAIGESVPVMDAAARVTGALEYLVNIRLPHMLTGKIVRSTVPHARLVRIDISRAERVPGVVAILTRADLDPAQKYGLALKDAAPVAIDRARYIGDPVAAVAAKDLEAAEEAAYLIDIEYEELPAVFDAAQAMVPGAPVLHDEYPNNVYRHAKLRHGDLAAGFAAADEVFEDVFTSPSAQTVPLEPHGAIAQWSGERLTVWSGTQAPFGVARVLADYFGLKPEDLRVIVPQLGGGYGGKGGVRFEPLAAALARKTAGRPVRVVLSRAEEFVTVVKHAATFTIKSGIKRDGTFTARQVTALWRGGAYADASANLVQAGLVRAIGPYRIPHVWVDSIGAYTNLPPAGSFRGAMTSQATWAYESHTDMIARRMGWDPVEFRLKNLLRDGDTFATGETMHGLHFDECLKAVLDARPRRSSTETRKVGRGCAVMMKSTIPTSKSQAKLRLTADGRLTVLISTVEMGQGSHTALAQIAGDALSLPMSAITVVGPDTAQTPFDLTTASSRSITMMGGAIQAAAENLKNKLTELAVHTLEAPPEELRIGNGRVASAGASVSFAEVLQRNNLQELETFGERSTNFRIDLETGQGIASPHWHQGAGAAEVQVDTETGRVTVMRYLASSYAGRIVNPALAQLQNDGNVIYGLGPTLFEEVLFDEGQVVNPNLSDYQIPSFRDLPLELQSVTLESPGSEMYGIGEMTLPPVSPAIANAIEDAVGVRITDLPITPDKVLRALKDRAEGKQV